MNWITKINRGWQFSFILLLVLVGVLYLAKIKSTLLPVKVVKIIGSYQHVQQDELMSVILPYVSKSILFMNLNGLSQHISQIPWVADAAAHRIWPGTVTIRFSEQTPFARWGEYQVMNADGDIFAPDQKTIPKDLPQLEGPTNQQKQILQAYQKMSEMLQHVGLAIEKMDMSNAHAYQLTLNNGTQLLMSQKAPDVELERYLKIYNDLFSQNYNQPVSVDLRYASGMTVK